MIKAIVFDKDGTLLRYEPFWVPVAEAACRELLASKDLPADLLGEILDAIGTHSGIAGLLCYGTYAEAAECINLVVSKRKDTPFTAEAVESAMKRNTCHGSIVPTCDGMQELFCSLQKKGLRLGLVTTDSPDMTAICLEKLGIAHFFDAVYCDDGRFPAKPAPHCMQDFCRRFSLVFDEVLMVGDTLTDMRFAQNSGTHSIGVAEKERDRLILLPHAECILHDISHIIDLLPSVT